MTSDELNAAVREVADDPVAVGFEAFGGKAVPYIGWFWRTVDFDQTDGYWFGFIRDTGHVGFMENNKWDYESVRADAGQWAAIKAGLVRAVTTRAAADFRAVNDLIQSLATGTG